MTLAARLTRAWRAKLGAEAEWLRYGPDSYAPGGAHPELEKGTRRAEKTLALDVESRYALGSGFELIATFDVKRRLSNLPDYRPGIYPRTRRYDIDWDYVNVVGTLGVRWEQR